MLITLVIIGVIAALTIPNLMQKYQEQATVKKVQKFYSTLSNAYSLATKDNGEVEEWGLTLTAFNRTSLPKIYDILFKPYFKIAKDCNTTNTGNCIPNISYKLLSNGSTYNFASANWTYKIALEDGTVVLLSIGDNQISIIYDSNGIKWPNQFGKDTFHFKVKDNKLFPVGIQQTEFIDSCNTKIGYGYGCAAWVIYKGNMDYLHCDGLTWDKHSCKD